MTTWTLRISSDWNYRGRRSAHRTSKTFEDIDHMRNYARKVISTARDVEDVYKGKRSTRRNTGSLARFISVWPEGTKEGDIVDVWSRERGWHKGIVYNRPRYMSSEPDLRTKSIEEN